MPQTAEQARQFIVPSNSDTRCIAAPAIADTSEIGDPLTTSHIE